MANRPSYVAMSIYAKSLDGLWYTQFPYGTAEANQAALAAALSAPSSVSGRVSAAIRLGASLSGLASVRGSVGGGAPLAAALSTIGSLNASLSTQSQAFYDGDISVSGNRWINGAGLDISSSLQGGNLQGLETSSAQGFAPFYGQNMAPVIAIAAKFAMNCLRIPYNSASFLAATSMPGLVCRNIGSDSNSWNGPARSPDPTGTYLAQSDQIIDRKSVV